MPIPTSVRLGRSYCWFGANFPFRDMVTYRSWGQPIHVCLSLICIIINISCFEPNSLIHGDDLLLHFDLEIFHSNHRIHCNFQRQHWSLILWLVTLKMRSPPPWRELWGENNLLKVQKLVSSWNGSNISVAVLFISFSNFFMFFRRCEVLLSEHWS